jgi:protein-disulfide isomerase
MSITNTNDITYSYKPYRQGQCNYIEPYPLTAMVRCEHDHGPDDQYCPEHKALMGQRGTRQRTRHKDIARANHIWDLESEFNEIVLELELEGEIEL